MNHKSRYSILMMTIILLLTWINTIFSQNTKPKTSRSKAIEMLQRADAQYNNSSYSVAAKDYEEYLIQDGSHPETVLSKLADCYYQMRANDNALRVYKLLFKNGKEGATELQKIRVGELYARHGMYQQAADWLKDVKGYSAKASVYNSAISLDSLKKDSLNWKIGFLNVNTPYRDYSPVLIDSVLFFTSNKPLSVKKQVSLWDNFCYTSLHKVELNKIKSEPIGAPIAGSFLAKKETKGVLSKSVAPQYEGADAKDMESELYFMTDRRYMWNESKDTLGSVVKGLEKIDFNVTGIALDNNSRVYFSANYSQNRKSINRVRLMEGMYASNRITNIRPLPFGDNKSYSVMLPTVNEDGSVLVFCSDMPKGKGKMDLYFSIRNAKTHKWSNPEAFSSNINTVGNEVFPTITSDGYLYFSSDARPGLGGLDIYRIPLEDAIKGSGEPEHLSYPINSSADDFGWTQDNAGKRGFFSSDRLDNDDNLYSFSYKDIYLQMSNIEGKVVDMYTHNPIEGATVFMLNDRTAKVIATQTDSKGMYHFVTSSVDKVILKAMKEGMTNDCIESGGIIPIQEMDVATRSVQDMMLEKQRTYTKPNDYTKKGVKSIDVTSGAMKDLISNKQELEVNDRWKLNNIHYNFNKWDIRPDATPTLDSLITLLKIYPIKIELGSYTDSRGTSQYNDTLSQKRAESVVAYLVKHGIDRNRLIAVGHGERNILNRCIDGVSCSENEHQVNRRTEVKVISNGNLLKLRNTEIDLNKFKKGEQINKSNFPVDFFYNFKRNTP
ncbi:OmpA/MotB domain protein [Paludibacter propionicigenes WB4]|uniref:OmpA/MotB domain protein n=1 Tax=Paludibacter propionicigenes (strain DSM 17365 / JCM 13257 / WB4) TaxID=694427 RepID=E4T3D8_PALPW|nr:OmpA family protein [Paludibacter propionicigenes]ADQ79232.1 OmpA/MotB domain protein [Paludibacter propionicigenes WB4]